MVGVVICTHGGLAKSLVDTAVEVLGTLQNVEAAVLPSQGTEDELMDRLKAAVNAVDLGDGVLVLVDIFGGTPSNLSLKLARHRLIEVVAGVNLPMVFKAVENRGTDVRALARAVQEAGIRNIVLATVGLTR